MKKGLLFASLVLLIGLTGCEGIANNNIVADIFIGNEWGMLLVSIILIVPSIFAITKKRYTFILHFFVEDAAFGKRTKSQSLIWLWRNLVHILP